MARKKTILDGADLARRLREWGEITDLCLAVRGGKLLGPGHTLGECIAAGLRECNRLRDERTGRD